MNVYRWATKCNFCYKKFRIYRRKHYCIACDKLYCSDCCNEWILLPGNYQNYYLNI